MEKRFYADIQNKLYEAKIFKENERIVDIIDNCVLSARFTGKSYSYRIIDLFAMKSKYLFSKANPLTEENYEAITVKIKELNFNREAEILRLPNYIRARNLLTYIFTFVLPQHNMALRESQKNLAFEILISLQENKISFCEAEVGTGKTHAYILAVIVYNIFSDTKKSALISTSTIALQKALTEQYIPQISSILQSHKILDKRVSFIVRKGKSHYICDNNFEEFVSVRNSTEEHKAIKLEIEKNISINNIDLDSMNLSDFVKKRIRVNKCHRSCNLYNTCSYNSFKRNAMKKFFDFHITNHNFVLADSLNKKSYRNALLPKYDLVVFDEAHKLPDTIKEMYKTVVKFEELENIIDSANILYKNKEMCKIYRNIHYSNKILFSRFKNLNDEVFLVKLLSNERNAVHSLISHLKQLSASFFNINTHKKQAFRNISNQADTLIDKLKVFYNKNDFVFWVETENLQMVALNKNLGNLFYEDFLSNAMPVVFTSGTLSINNNFSHIKQELGTELSRQASFEISISSPFDYERNALLYLPKSMPFPSINDTDYRQAIFEQIEKLISLTHGHTLILFTSYQMMEQTFLEINKSDYPMFMMGKGRVDVLDAFRNSVNGVLFASDTAGEGIDLVGDILSSVIVVKLPFPIPDPISEHESSLYDEFGDYLNNSIIPSMLIKLRQWIGRGIRNETDTCVFSILDSRAAARYKNDILTALPKMPVTREINDVGRFILNRKDEKYFIKD